MVFVTGGTGFLGAYLLAELVKKNELVVALKRPGSSTFNTEKLFSLKFEAEGQEQFQKIKWVDGDILDPWSLSEAMQGIKDVYHCAAEVSLRDHNPDSIINTATKGTENMVHASLVVGVEKFCHVSSVVALGKPAENYIDEECFEDFSFKNAPYSIGKHLAELQVWKAHAEGLKVVIVSPSIILGPWNYVTDGSMSMFPYIDKTSLFYTRGVMGFVDVNDVVNTMLLLMEKGPYNERFIINSENISFKDIITTIAININKPIPRIPLSYSTLKIFKLLNNIWNKQKISNTMVEHATGTHSFSNMKVKKTLSYSFIPVDKSIETTAKFYISERGRK